MRPDGRYSVTRVEESIPPSRGDEHWSVSAGPFRSRFRGGATALVILALVALLGYVLHLTLGRPTDAQVTWQARAAIAENALQVEQREHEELRQARKADLERVNRMEDELRNEIAIKCGTKK